MRDLSLDVVVVGAGPAGLGAAHAAAGHGLRVAVVDDNPAAGGQVWRGESNLWTALPPSVEWIHARALEPADPGVLLAEEDQGALTLRFGKLVIATGARERFLPFPGWTTPGVFGAGGMQALAKSGLPVAGKRVVVAGTGPLILEVASYLRRRGATVVAVAEQASWATLMRFSAALRHLPSKIGQAFSIASHVATVLRTGTWIAEVHGSEWVEAVTLGNGRRRWRERCDAVACGFHLVPNLELASLFGCQMEDGFVMTNQSQQTSVPDVFCAGEPCGIGGMEKALIEGRIAGHAAAGEFPAARSLHRARAKTRFFQAALDRATRLRPELSRLATAETIVCRCEDVTLARIAKHKDWRSAKLQTRCGMGPCQGRVCGTAVEHLFGWSNESLRPPVFPARVGTVAELAGVGTPSRELR